MKTRNTGIWTGGPQDVRVNVAETYDGFGRLVSVTEKSGPTSAASPAGSDVLTTYRYDIGDRLTEVKMGVGGGTVQVRTFDYDGRGFLRWENQPESGIASFTYDARGHVLTKIQSAASSLFDLKYTYDSAERLTRIEGRNPLYPGTGDQFRVLKVFEFATLNEAGNLLAPQEDRRRGKLFRATRYNYGETVNDQVFAVADTYTYKDVAGRKTGRNTAVSQLMGSTWSLVKSFDMTMTYDALDMPKSIKYPTCDGCGTPPTDPDRTGMTRTYAAGRLKTLSGYVDDVIYWPNGMRNVLAHSNGIADTQMVGNMGRPTEISFGRYDRCVKPSFATQPASGKLPASGSVQLSVSVSGTAPIAYQWWKGASPADLQIQGATAPTLTVSPTTPTDYYVVVTNRCGYEQSQTARITINDCPVPVVAIGAILQPDGSWILTPDLIAAAPVTYAWKNLSGNIELGHERTQAVGLLSATTTYRLTISDSCNATAFGDVTITIPLPITIGLQATAMSSYTQIGLTWPAIPGATQYTVRRRSAGPWETLAFNASSPFVDTTVQAGRTYAYQVTSTNGGSTDVDVATTMPFVAAVVGQSIDVVAANAMLSAVNKVRAAAGWPSLAWSNILAANDPLPAPGMIVTGRHITSCRARMNEALQALGVRVRDYTDSELAGRTIKASYFNEVQQRAQ